MKKAVITALVIGAIIGIVNSTRPRCPVGSFAQFWMGWHCLVEKAPIYMEVEPADSRYKDI